MSKRAAKEAEDDEDSVEDEHIRPNFPAVSASSTAVSINYLWFTIRFSSLFTKMLILPLECKS